MNQEIATSAIDNEFEQLLSKDFDAAKPGEIVFGKVTEIGRDYVLVDIGFKSEGHIPICQFASENGETKVNVGDTVEVKIDSTTSKIYVAPPALATEDDAGLVKMAANVAAIDGEAVTVEKFNALLTALINAGIMAGEE